MFPGTVADFLALHAQGLPVKAASLPGPDKSSRITEAQVWALGMFDVPPTQLYKVQEFAFWLTDFPQQRRWAEETPYLAAHVKVFDNPFYRRKRAEVHSSLRVFLSVLNRSRPLNTTEKAISVLDNVGKQIPSVLKGEKTPAEILPPKIGLQSKNL